MRVHFSPDIDRGAGEHGAALYPGGPGILYPDPWGHAVSQRSLYPNGWCTMQFMATYGGDGQDASGLYVAVHDPDGSTKEIVLDTQPRARSVRMAFEHPAAGMGAPGNSFRLNGEAVLADPQRRLVRCSPHLPALGQLGGTLVAELTAEGRADTPLWMRDLCGWAQTGGDPKDVVEPVKQMASALRRAHRFHWYSWHQIPFDNDYPHYFPTRPASRRPCATCRPTTSS